MVAHSVNIKNVGILWPDKVFNRQLAPGSLFKNLYVVEEVHLPLCARGSKRSVSGILALLLSTLFLRQDLLLGVVSSGL